MAIAVIPVTALAGGGAAACTVIVTFPETDGVDALVALRTTVSGVEPARYRIPNISDSIVPLPETMIQFTAVLNEPVPVTWAEIAVLLPGAIVVAVADAVTLVTSFATVAETVIETVPLLLGVVALVALNTTVSETEPARYCSPPMVLSIAPPPETMIQFTAVLNEPVPVT